jgi:GT2 family glycosyltransferase
MKKVSVIIPVKEINDYIRESLPYIEKLDYDKSAIEVIVLPDFEGVIEGKFSFDLKIIATTHIYPGEKRDIGIRHSTGEIIAFIDDDVFPCSQWLKKAVEIFESDNNIAAVGGPAATPDNDSFLQKASGSIYASFLGGGGYRFRYMAEPARYVDDFPSCNLIIKKEVLDRIGGFNTEFWPGEDTVICLKITRDLKMKIKYDPEVFVYHHRRKFPAGHFNQVKSYALHRGYFVKRFPETSLRLSYFIPTFFMLYMLSFLYPLLFAGQALLLWSVPLMIYCALLVAEAFTLKDIRSAFVVLPGIFLHHMCYGIYFIRGLLSATLKEEKKK